MSTRGGQNRGENGQRSFWMSPYLGKLKRNNEVPDKLQRNCQILIFFHLMYLKITPLKNKLRPSFNRITSLT